MDAQAIQDRFVAQGIDLPPFPPEEYERRQAAVRARMAERGIDVLLVTDPANMCYLTGYDAWSFYVHQLLVVELDGGAPLWIGRASDANGAVYTTYLPAENVIGYPETCIESLDNHTMRFVGDLLVSRGRGNGSVGTEMEAYYFTARCQQMLEATLPNARFVDATGLVNRVRIVKTEPELAYIREAGRIVDIAMQTAVDTIAPGVRQCDAVAAVSHAQIVGTPEYGGEYASIVPMLPTGILSGAPHITWSDRRFREGEGTIVEIAGCRKRYHCPLARTVFLGTPPQELLDTAEAVVEGVAAALDAARPGNRAEDVEAVWRKTIAKWGVVKESRLGYSIGINYPPDWGEHSTSLRPGDATVLEPDMTFHMMPGLWYERWGIEISQSFRVTDGAPEALTTCPRELIVKA